MRFGDQFLLGQGESQSRCKLVTNEHSFSNRSWGVLSSFGDQFLLGPRVFGDK